MTRTELPLDIRLMSLATQGLVLVFLGLCLTVLASWVVRWPMWTIRAIAVEGDTEHQDPIGLKAQLAAPLRTQLTGGLLGADLRPLQDLFESVPWVRSAQVRREFPNRLRVTLEEHRAVAWWGQSGGGQLVNEQGEIFEATPDDGDGLPELAGPTDRAADVWALYQALQPEWQHLRLGLLRLELNDRGSWRAELDSGAKVELGRGSHDELLDRARRFTRTIGQLAERYPAAIQTVDLRYPNGYALRMQGVTTVTETEPAAAHNTR